MTKINPTRWISLIYASSRQGLHKHTLQLYQHMQTNHELTTNPYVVSTALRACANLSQLHTGKALHAIVLRSLLNSDVFIRCALIDMYCKCYEARNARNVFDEMLDRDLVVWNSMISGYASHGQPGVALVLSIKMRAFGFRPDKVTWNALISGFSLRGDEDMSMSMLNFMKLDEIEPDVVSWTSIISGLVFGFKYGKAFRMFKQMMEVARVQPNSFTVSNLLSACSNVADLQRGKEIHGYAVVTNLQKDLYVSSALTDMYAKCGVIDEAIKIFNGMEQKNTITWNSMIFAYANHGYCEEAINLFYKMNDAKVKFDHLTITAVLSACSHAGKVELGMSIFQAMQEDCRIQTRMEHYACMVDMLGRAGKLQDAYILIKEMPTKPDSFVWGALLGATRNHGNVELAELAASHLSNLETESAGNHLLLSDVLANAGKQRDAFKIKKLIKRRKMRTFMACSWMHTI